MNAELKKLLDAGRITQAEFDAVVSASPAAPEAWTAREEAHAAEVQRITAERDAAIAREAAKDKIIVSFSTKTNPNAKPDGDAMTEAVDYINKKRGLK